MPTTAAATRPYRSQVAVLRHATGRQAGSIAAKYARPSTATGIPNTFDCALVVTCRQFSTPLSEQASVVDDVKCSNVKYAESARPIATSTSDVAGSHRGTYTWAEPARAPAPEPPAREPLA